METIVFGVYQTASSTTQHGSYTLTVGSQTITQKSLASIKSELKRLYEKLGEEDKLDALNGSDGDVRWINEYE